ncbi:LptF/LptG family permease [Rubripirellula lacrimiformis]|uniref:LptF/LptG family permease n=1 Tax=Rubripirellula lacrimiformis TaxID=1930273 RepID=UPI0011A65565|nr:LptF/LptG family permease [Rubripirellula lacrimiformis]
MTKIDRYILLLFLRTVFICFCSISGIFVVFHAFTSMDELVKQGQEQDGLVLVMCRFYGPYLLLLFDWTGAIITLMAFLFTVGWLRRTGELTSTLAAGISHGRLLRPMIIASLLIVLAQLSSRELLLPSYRDALSMKAKDITGESEQPILAQYDKVNRVLIDGKSLIAQSGRVIEPSFRLDGEYPGYGDLLLARSGVWMEASADHPGGYLLDGVQRPEDIDALPSVGIASRPILYSSSDQAWLKPRQCFFATTVHVDLLQTNQSATRMASVMELIGRVKNPAVHSSLSLQVLLHERIIRPALDFSLILLGLPLVVNRRGRNLFVMIAAAMGTVLAFFVIKTLCGALGGNGYWLSPAMAAWLPLIILGPLAYLRYRDVQLV